MSQINRYTHNAKKENTLYLRTNYRAAEETTGGTIKKK